MVDEIAEQPNPAIIHTRIGGCQCFNKSPSWRFVQCPMLFQAFWFCCVGDFKTTPVRPWWSSLFCQSFSTQVALPISGSCLCRFPFWDGLHTKPFTGEYLPYAGALKSFGKPGRSSFVVCTMPQTQCGQQQHIHWRELRRKRSSFACINRPESTYIYI